MVSRRKRLPPRDPDAQVDLHGLAPEQALRALSRGLHAARLRRATSVLVITGKGWGNREQKPILRQKVEAYLRGPDGLRAGVEGFTLESHGGALLVRMRRDAQRHDGADDDEEEEDDVDGHDERS